MAATRVLMVCDHFYPDIGGAERQAQLLGESLIQAGCEVSVLTPRRNPDLPETSQVGGLALRRFPYRDLSARFPGVRGLGVPNSLFMRQQVRAAIADAGSFDILHSHIATPLTCYAAEYAAEIGKPSLCKVGSGGDGFDFNVMKRTSMLGPMLVGRAVRVTSQWVAISGEIAMQLAAGGVAAERLQQIPNGVKLPDTGFDRQSGGARRFLYLGRLSRSAHKDFPGMLRAFDRLATEFPDVELRLVGGGELEGDVRRELDRLPNAGARTELVGFSAPGPWLAWADVLVHPSLAEGMSNTLLEAMATGLCCVANDIPANREVLGDGTAGLLVPVGDVGRLADTLRRLAEVPGESHRIGRAGRRYAESRYALEAVTDAYIALYQRMLEARRPVGLVQ